MRGVVYVTHHEANRQPEPEPLVGPYEDGGTQPPRVRVWCGAPACRARWKDHTAPMVRRCAEARARAAGWPRWLARLEGEFAS